MSQQGQTPSEPPEHGDEEDSAGCPGSPRSEDQISLPDDATLDAAPLHRDPRPGREFLFNEYVEEPQATPGRLLRAKTKALCDILECNEFAQRLPRAGQRLTALVIPILRSYSDALDDASDGAIRPSVDKRVIHIVNDIQEVSKILVELRRDLQWDGQQQHLTKRVTELSTELNDKTSEMQHLRRAIDRCRKECFVFLGRDVLSPAGSGNSKPELDGPCLADELEDNSGATRSATSVVRSAWNEAVAYWSTPKDISEETPNSCRDDDKAGWLRLLFLYPAAIFLYCQMVGKWLWASIPVPTLSQLAWAAWCILFAVTANTYVALVRERETWWMANGVTKRHLIWSIDRDWYMSTPYVPLVDYRFVWGSEDAKALAVAMAWISSHAWESWLDLASNMDEVLTLASLSI